jgi:DNA helicase-2/ATP-dependent DNA helicase PcrA
MTDGVLPHFRKVRRDNVEEERRLFYVAVTRAESHVYLFSTPVTWERVTRSSPTQFLTKAVLRILDGK